MENLMQNSTSPDLSEDDEDIIQNIYLESKKKYTVVYKKFISWKKSKKVTAFSEELFMEYFRELAKMYKPSSLWSMHSMLRQTLLTNNHIDIRKYPRLSAFLKKQSIGFVSKQCKVLSPEEVTRFLNDAPDDVYLATKVALIMGMAGSCNREELCYMTMDSVTDYDGTLILVKLLKKKSLLCRQFTITDEYYKTVKKYMRLRPKKCKLNRFFLNYQKGKCFQQPIGIHKFGNMPKEIARFLGLADAESYTGHSFRRASLSLPLDTPTDITLKREEILQSNQEKHLEDSIGNNWTCNKIRQIVNVKEEAVSPTASTSAENGEPVVIEDAVLEFEFVEVPETNEQVMRMSSRVNNTGPDFEVVEAAGNREKARQVPTTVNNKTSGSESAKTTENNEPVLPPSLSSSISSTVNNQTIDLSSIIKFPHGRFNLTINNSNVTFNFYGKQP